MIFLVLGIALTYADPHHWWMTWIGVAYAFAAEESHRASWRNMHMK